MTKPDPKTIEHREEGPTSLPSMHIVHSAVFLNEIDTRIMGFDSGIVAIDADMSGMQKQFDVEQAERTRKYEEEQAESTRVHAEKMKERNTLKRDLERGRRMAMAAKAVYSEDPPPDVGQREDEQQ